MESFFFLPYWYSYDDDDVASDPSQLCDGCATPMRYFVLSRLRIEMPGVLESHPMWLRTLRSALSISGLSMPEKCHQWSQDVRVAHCRTPLCA